MIRAVLFDYDGVLSVTDNKSSLSDAIAHFYGTRIGWGKLGDLHEELSRGSITSEQFFHELAKRHESSKVVTEAMWHDAFKDIFHASKPMYEMAAALRRQKITTGILSNTYEMTARELRRRGSYDGFDPIVLSYEVGYMKPEPAIYHLVLRELSVGSREVVLVDDREKCLAPAAELGMQVLLAETVERTVADLTRLVQTENGVTL